MSLLKVPEKILKLIPFIIKEIVGIVKEKKHAEKISRTDSIDENSTIEDINKVLDMFSDYKEQLNEKAGKLETILMEEVKAYIEELKDILKGKQETIRKYGLRTERIEKRFDSLMKGIQGSIDREVSKRVSLDNYECRQIIKMIPGKKKEEAMTCFFKNTIKAAIDQCCDEFQSALEELFGETKEELVEILEIIQRENEKNVNDLASVDKDNYAEKTLEIQDKAYNLISICDIVDLLMEGDY